MSIITIGNKLVTCFFVHTIHIIAIFVHPFSTDKHLYTNPYTQQIHAIITPPTLITPSTLLFLYKPPAVERKKRELDTGKRQVVIDAEAIAHQALEFYQEIKPSGN